MSDKFYKVDKIEYTGEGNIRIEHKLVLPKNKGEIVYKGYVTKNEAGTYNWRVTRVVAGVANDLRTGERKVRECIYEQCEQERTRARK